MSKIKKITVSNLKAVSSLTADFNGCTAIIVGGNNKGKSSFLRSLVDRLRGLKPEQVLKQGESKGFYTLELTSGEKFQWDFNNTTKAGEKLTFVSERNIPSAVTKELSTYYFPPVFDVDKFLNSTPAKQKQDLQKLTGIDFTEFDKLYKTAYDERTYRNKCVTEEKAKATFIDKSLPETEEPTEELEKELAGIDAHKMRYDTVAKQVTDKEKAVSENNAEIERLTQLIVALGEKNEILNDEIERGNVWMQDEKNKPKNNADELKASIAKIKLDNEKIKTNNEAKKQDESLNKAVELADAADKEVKRLEAEKLEVIKNSSMPDGFGFSEDGITYNGFDFNKQQLSSSGIYIAALKLAALGLGEVKTLHFDASYLDKNSLADIEKWANDNDLQLLIERPDFDGGEIEYQIIENK